MVVCLFCESVLFSLIREKDSFVHCMQFAYELRVLHSILKEEKYKPHPELPSKSWNACFYFCTGEMLEKGNNLCLECQFCVMKYPCFFPFYVLNSLKLECEKLASEKTEMQRHYVMVSKLHNEFKMSISLYTGTEIHLNCWRRTERL